MSAVHIIFRVIYDSFYVFLSLIVLLLLLEYLEYERDLDLGVYERERVLDRLERTE